jgi:hypothetical protein
MTLSARRPRQKPNASPLRRRVSTSSRLPQGERYTPARKAEFLLNNAGTEAEYQVARREVKALGLDPDSVPHVRPNSR